MSSTRAIGDDESLNVNVKCVRQTSAIRHPYSIDITAVADGQGRFESAIMNTTLALNYEAVLRLMDALIAEVYGGDVDGFVSDHRLWKLDVERKRKMMEEMTEGDER